MRGGSSLAAALMAEPRSFARLYVSLIQAGEAGGNLTDTFERLAVLLERQRSLAATVQSALVYPVLLVIVAAGSITLLLTKVLPKAGSFDPDKIKAAIMALDEPIGSTILGFGIKFAAEGQNSRSFNVVLQWQKGELVTVWPQRFATAAPIMVPLPDWGQAAK